MKFFYRILTVVCIGLLTVQCDLVDEDLLNSPNSPSPANVDPDFLLNNIQIEARNVYAGAAGTGAEMTRMRYMFGDTYANAYTSQTAAFNNLYQNAYADLFIDVENLLPIAQERNLYFHAGVAKTLKAYAMLTLVDVFGDVPYSEALDASNFNPALDSGSAIYDSALVLLDEAIADLQNEDRLAFPDTDLYYGEASDQVNAWVRAANTMKLKAHLNTGNATAFNALVADDNLILDPADDFTYQFGTNTTNPDARHPLFSNNYVDQANNYMTVNYMNMMLNDKPEEDPRLRYYFYRQTTSDPAVEDVNLNTCLAATKPTHFTTDDPFCYPTDNGEDGGWWGRDHLIDDGIPPDGDLRTTFGVYPVGGRFDANQGVPTEPDQGLQGAGFEPILMSFYTHFMIAEAELTLNSDPTAAKTALDEALALSFETVADFGASQADGTGLEMSAADIADHQTEVDNRWNDAGYDNLRVISKEYYLALWPNGLEAYNMMRRTGYPNRLDNLQPTRTPSPGDWYRTFMYPANLVEQNSNVSQHPNLTRTFWDTRGDANEFNF